MISRGHIIGSSMSEPDELVAGRHVASLKVDNLLCTIFGAQAPSPRARTAELNGARTPTPKEGETCSVGCEEEAAVLSLGEKTVGFRLPETGAFAHSPGGAFALPLVSDGGPCNGRRIDGPLCLRRTMGCVCLLPFDILPVKVRSREPFPPDTSTSTQETATHSYR